MRRQAASGGWLGMLVVALAFSMPVATPAPASELRVDTGFPGGNIIVDRIEGDHVYVQPDVRETRGRWFYWYFRVRDAGSRTLTFHFTVGTPMSVRGPAVSTDGGNTWNWLGVERTKAATFTYSFSGKETEVRFSMGMPYTERNLRVFCARFASRPDFVVGSLAKSEHGRDVELLRLGKLNGAPRFRVALTARHHACEMMASYLLEGIIEAVFADDATGSWLRENVEFLVVPLMDKDGVEEGLQGKNRVPHDHCRDYVGEPRYAAVAAIKKLLPAWADGRLRIALDLHCPALRGKGAENIHFVGGPVPAIWEQVGRFSEILARTQQGPLVYRVSDNLPHGTQWNTLAEPSSFNLWAAGIPGISFSTTLEFPYADIRGAEVNPETARGFGHGVARAMREYLAK